MKKIILCLIAAVCTFAFTGCNDKKVEVSGADLIKEAIAELQITSTLIPVNLDFNLHTLMADGKVKVDYSVTKSFVQTLDKDGKPVVDKDGKPVGMNALELNPVADSDIIRVKVTQGTQLHYVTISAMFVAEGSDTVTVQYLFVVLPKHLFEVGDIPKVEVTPESK